jgi:hypothetical protein
MVLVLIWYADSYNPSRIQMTGDAVEMLGRLLKTLEDAGLNSIAG